MICVDRHSKHYGARKIVEFVMEAGSRIVRTYFQHLECVLNECVKEEAGKPTSSLRYYAFGNELLQPIREPQTKQFE